MPAPRPRSTRRPLRPPRILANAPIALAALAVLTALLLSACASLAPGVDAGLDAEQREVLRLVNEARAAGARCGDADQPPAALLTADPNLVRAAQKHAEDMAAAGTMTHTTPEGAVHYAPGTRFDERIAVEGYSYRSAGENIAWGYPSAEAVVAGWLGSPGHCRNILNSAFSEIGLGEEGSYWAQVFAAPQPER